ncbi:MAG TPA: LysR substrate-binding domain-containing protein [Burkholderiales bacterium]|nr:LysR substrate-binding domain-containing protein [Burkholderiales bacterium]
MNLQQLRYLHGIAEHGFNISRAATALHTSQPGISRQIQLLEQEIGIAILARKGNRIVGVTEPGRAVLEVARRMVQDAENLKRIGEDFTSKDSGRLVIATTHMHARYVLRDVIRDFIGRHPHVQLVLRQVSPAQTAQLVATGEADIGVSGQPPGAVSELVMLPCYELHRSVIAPRDHPLLAEKRLTLKSIARYPIITLDQSFVGGSAVLRAFDAAGIRPNVVLSAIDADVVKTYVELGLGIAILPSIAYEPRRDTRLCAIDAAKLFEPTIACIELRHENYLRSYMLDFIQCIAPQWSRETIADARRARDVVPRAATLPLS